jgi:hypothetical protein
MAKSGIFGSQLLGRTQAAQNEFPQKPDQVRRAPGS